MRFAKLKANGAYVLVISFSCLCTCSYCAGSCYSGSHVLNSTIGNCYLFGGWEDQWGLFPWHAYVHPQWICDTCLFTCIQRIRELKLSFQLFLLNLSNSQMRWILGCMCMDMVCAHECHGTALLNFFIFHVRAIASRRKPKITILVSPAECKLPMAHAYRATATKECQ